MRKRILVVEDDRDILNILQELLVSEGYDTVTASSGLKALEILNKSEKLPDLIIIDFMMPEMNAVEFRAEQKKNPRFSAIPIFLITADARPDQKHLQIGARAYMKKPLELTKFLAAIEKCLS